MTAGYDGWRIPYNRGVDDDAAKKAHLARAQAERGNEEMGKTYAAALVIASLISVTKNAAVGSDRPDAHAWRVGVTKVCTGALLFEGRHSIGTEQGAIAVARDIRASTARRLTRIKALRADPERPLTASHWLRVEHHLSELYASSYLGIWHTIAHANTPAERARLPRILGQMLHRPDVARAQARLLERQLRVPDCTGGENTDAEPSIAFKP
jgi:hypothetical protein